LAKSLTRKMFPQGGAGLAAALRDAEAAVKRDPGYTISLVEKPVSLRRRRPVHPKRRGAWCR
jgi:hypothetical protein